MKVHERQVHESFQVADLSWGGGGVATASQRGKLECGDVGRKLDTHNP